MTSSSTARFLWRKKWLIAAAGIICAIIAAAVSVVGAVTWTSSTTVILLVNPSNPGSNILDDRTTGTEAVFAEGTTVRSAVSRALGGSKGGTYSVSARPSTNALVFQASGTSREAADTVARTAARQYGDVRLDQLQDRYRATIEAADKAVSQATARQRRAGSNSAAAQRAQNEALQQLQTRSDAQQQLSAVPAVSQVSETSSSPSRTTLGVATRVLLGLILGVLLSGLVLLLVRLSSPRIEDVSDVPFSTGRTWTLSLRDDETAVTSLRRMLSTVQPLSVLVTGTAGPSTLNVVREWVAETGYMAKTGDVDHLIESLQSRGRHLAASAEEPLVVVGDSESVESALLPVLDDRSLVLFAVERRRSPVEETSRRLAALQDVAIRVDTLLLTNGRR